MRRFRPLIMPSILHSWPALARAAPRLSRQFFTCRHCQKLGLKIKQDASKDTWSRYRYYTSLAGSGAIETRPGLSSPLSSLGRSINRSRGGNRRFPEISEKIVAYWLLGSAASVFGIVVFGGLTRLTESG